MKIVNVLGGLGNQMFQYAFAISLQSEFSDEIIKLNKLCFNGYPLHNGFELDKIFNINLPYANIQDLIKSAWPWNHYRLWQLGRRILPNRKSMVWDTDLEIFNYDLVSDKSYFDGYWQSPRFFEKHRQDVISAMEFPPITDENNLNAIRFINDDKTAFIHVRRGDYINHPTFGGICNLDYYQRGISILLEHHFSRFLIFSNDINWCKTELSKFLGHCNIMYVDWNSGLSSFRDMQLMSLCHGGLIANSSFSWWGAWLSNADVIVCPNKWSNKPNHRTDIYSNNWIKI